MRIVELFSLWLCVVICDGMIFHTGGQLPGRTLCDILDIECVPLTILIYFIVSLSLKFGACYITGQWSEFKVTNATLCLYILFWYFFIVHQNSCVFIILLSFFDEVSNYRNKILTNRKTELMKRNCQWNCMIDLNYNNGSLITVH